jgi:Family of unknown function (DUF6516)
MTKPKPEFPGEQLLEKERFELKPKSGGGLLNYEVWGTVVKGVTTVTRYNLAYINPLVHAGDNGRVLGFDNAHDYHHRHFMGQVEAVDFVSYEATVERFQQEWQELIKSFKESKK